MATADPTRAHAPHRPPRLEELPDPPAGRTGWPWTTRPESAPDPDLGGLPHITIVTPSYNQGRYIEATIRSVLLQGYPNLEFLVIDGGSTDETVEIIRRYEPWIAYWQSQPDGGQTDAINQGFSRADGRVLGWLNSDDILLPGALRAVGRAVRDDPDAVAWVGSCYRITPDGRLLSIVEPRGLDQPRLADWGASGFFYQPSCFFSAEAVVRLGYLDAELHYSFDHDLWIRLAALGRFEPIDGVLSAAVIHPDAKSQAHRNAMHAETVLVQLRHGYRDAALARIQRLLDRPRLRELVRRYLAVKSKQVLGAVIPGLRRRPPTLQELIDASAGP